MLEASNLPIFSRPSAIASPLLPNSKSIDLWSSCWYLAGSFFSRSGNNWLVNCLAKSCWAITIWAVLSFRFGRLPFTLLLANLATPLTKSSLAPAFIALIIAGSLNSEDDLNNSAATSEGSLTPNSAVVFPPIKVLSKNPPPCCKLPKADLPAAVLVNSSLYFFSSSCSLFILPPVLAKIWAKLTSLISLKLSDKFLVAVSISWLEAPLAIKSFNFFWLSI